MTNKTLGIILRGDLREDKCSEIFQQIMLFGIITLSAFSLIAPFLSNKCSIFNSFCRVPDICSGILSGRW